VTSRAMKSSSPLTALTGVPSGAVIDSGTPKNARKYRLAASSNIRRLTENEPAMHLRRYARTQ
jgi:hypothetical protein